MSVTLTSSTTFSSGLAAGLGVLMGQGTCGQNYQAGEVMDLSNFFQEESNIVVVPTSCSNAYNLRFNTTGNSASTNVQIFSPDASNSNLVYQQIADATNVSTVSFWFLAVGPIR